MDASRPDPERSVDPSMQGLESRGPVVLSEEYRANLRFAEELACNRPGTDKSWVLRALQAHRRWFASVTQVHDS